MFGFNLDFHSLTWKIQWISYVCILQSIELIHNISPSAIDPIAHSFFFGPPRYKIRLKNGIIRISLSFDLYESNPAERTSSVPRRNRGSIDVTYMSFAYFTRPAFIQYIHILVECLVRPSVALWCVHLIVCWTVSYANIWMPERWERIVYLMGVLQTFAHADSIMSNVTCACERMCAQLIKGLMLFHY